MEQEAGQRGVVKGCSQLLATLCSASLFSAVFVPTSAEGHHKAFFLVYGEKQSTVGITVL